VTPGSEVISAAGLAPAAVGGAVAGVTLGEVLLWTSLALVGLVGAALCAGGEMGVYSVSRVRLAVRAKRVGWDSADALRAELEHTPRTLAVLLVGYNLFSYANSVGVTSLLSANGYSEAAIVAINVLVIAPVLFVVADTLPKELFRAEADRVMYALAKPLRWFRLLLTVTLVLPLTQAAARVLAGLLGGAGEEAIAGARERIAMLLKEGAQHGLISETQLSLLDRALALREAEVGDEMVPWDRCAKMEAEWDRFRALDYAAGRGFSRYPCVDGSGRVCGVVPLMELCLRESASPREVMRPVVELAEDLPVREALVRLAEADADLAVVVPSAKDSGVMAQRARRGPLGIVTRKDLVEPLTGELKAF
jgi:CBS domain containing-hemolysin-like protein